MTSPDHLPAGPSGPTDPVTTALQLRQQSYLLQTGLARPESAEEADDSITARDVLRIVARYKWLLLAAATLCMVVALVYGLTSTPVYQSTVLLQIDRASARIVQFNKDVDPSQESDFLALQTQYELLHSRSLAERVIDDLQLDPARGRVAGIAPGAPVGDAARGGASEVAASQGGWWASVLAGYRRLGKPSVNDREFLGREAVVQRFMNAVTVEPVRNSRLVKVKVANSNAAQAARIANAIAQAFIAVSMERRTQSSDYAKSFLEDQLKVTKVKLEQSERELNAYAKSNSLLTLDEKTNVINQTYTEYSSALSRVEQDRLKAESIYNAVAANPASASQVLDSKTVQAYKEQKAKIEADYLSNMAVYKPEFPKMLQLKAQIGELDERIKAEVASVLASIKGQFEAAKKQEEQVRARLQETRREVLVTQDKNVDLNLLKRELDTNRQLYDGLLQRMKEVGVTSGVTSNNISVVDDATTPLFPISPNFMLNAGIGLLAGLMLGTGFIALREQMDDSIKDANEIEAKLGLPLLGIIPLVKRKLAQRTDLALLTVEDPRSMFAEAYRSMRTALQFSTAEGAPRRMMVTSSVKGEGKSTTALSLAINFAQLGQRVLLIDADLRNPSLHKAVARSNESGLSSYLSGDAQREALIQATGIANLAVLTAGPHPPSPVDLLMGPRLLELLDRAEAMGFEKIVIDAPPVLGIADAIVLGNQVQNILFVVKAGDTRLSSIRDALRRMRLGGLMPLGVVLTSVSVNGGSYYDYYGGGYGAANAPRAADNRLARPASTGRAPAGAPA